MSLSSLPKLIRLVSEASSWPPLPSPQVPLPWRIRNFQLRDMLRIILAFSVSSHLQMMAAVASPAKSRFILLTVIFILAISVEKRVSSNGISHKERTLAIIKPDGVHGNYSDEIKNVILDSGFSILKEKRAQLDEDNARNFYVEHSSKSFFPSLLRYMTSGPVLIMVLEKENAVSDWRKLIGPTDAKKAKVTHPSSIRAMCGVGTERNCVHGSDSTESASREIVFFFGTLADEFDERHDEL